GYTEKLDVNNARIKKKLKEKKYPQAYTEAEDMLKVTEANFPIDSDLTAFPFETRELYPFGLTTIVPMYGAGNRLGT
ncbi:GTP-sensing pleiotropic transcriptional regulator CodY, partial [Enterococcus faecalis]